MRQADADLADDQRFVLSSLAPSRAQKRLALGVAGGLAVALYLVTGPFGGMRLGVVHSFVAMYTTAIFVTDALTGVLLFAQFSVLRSRSILVIASGYLFTAFLIVPYTLAFPGVLAPDGVVGGLQTSAGLYLSWHCGFPLFVIGYALLKDEGPERRVPPARVRRAVLRAFLATAGLAAAVATLCIVGEEWLPRIMLDRSQFTPEWPYLVGAPVALLCSTALLVLWSRRRSVLDLFLLVVLCAYLIEIPPHYYPVPARFSIGWYAVRVTSFISSSIVLVVLLYEITALYGGLLESARGQRRERAARLMTGDAVAASIAHEVRQPLTAMVTTADAGLRFLDRQAPGVDKAKEAFRRIVADGHRAGDVIASIRATFKGSDRERIALDMRELVREALAVTDSDLRTGDVSVRLHLADEVPRVRGSRVQLGQVLINLITNAIDAMADAPGAKTLDVRCVVGDDGRVHVSVGDNGSGVDRAQAQRMFAPLFTTKANGMGMGLSICRTIVEAHAGRLWYTPNPPRGTLFHFSLPSD